jgi:hypothetical protein
MSITIIKIAIEIFLTVFASIGLVFTCLAFYKGGVLQLDWDKLTEDFKREEPEEENIND